MDEAVYTLDGHRAVPSSFAAGPWDKTMQHGACPSGLLAFVLERVPTPIPMRVVRLTIDLMRPVPIAPLDIGTRIVREGRKIQIAEAELRASGTTVARGTAMRIRIDDTELPPGLDLPPLKTGVPGPEFDMTPRMGRAGFLSGVERREGPKDLSGPGTGSFWSRLARPIVAGHAPSPVVRAAALCDFANGLGRKVDPFVWTFLNADNSLYFARDPVGEWILLDGGQWYGREGSGFASARLADEAGYFGHVLASLVLEKRAQPLKSSRNATD